MVVRRIDDLGRIAIPKDVRKQLGIEWYDLLEISVDGDKIVLRKVEEENNGPAPS